MVNVNLRMNPPDVLRRLSVKDQFSVLFRVAKHMQQNVADRRENSLPAMTSQARIQRGNRLVSDIKLENVKDLTAAAGLSNGRIIDLVLTRTGELAIDYIEPEVFRIMTYPPWMTDARGEIIFSGAPENDAGNVTTQIPPARIDHVILELSEYLTFMQRHNVNKLSRTPQQKRTSR